MFAESIFKCKICKTTNFKAHYGHPPNKGNPHVSSTCIVALVIELRGTLWDIKNGVFRKNH